jgi:hypothetical protein
VSITLTYFAITAHSFVANQVTQSQQTLLCPQYWSHNNKHPLPESEAALKGGNILIRNKKFSAAANFTSEGTEVLYRNSSQATRQVAVFRRTQQQAI